MNMAFTHPWILVLLWLAPAAAAWWVFVWRRGRARLAAFVGADLQPRLAPAVDERRVAWQIGLMGCALAAMLLAAAWPTWGEKLETVSARGRDLMIVLDVSRSMLADDVRPNRLARAKADLLDLIAELRGDRAGLLAFRNKAALLCPLTTDHTFLRQALDGAGVESAPRGGTDIGDAIAKALDAFEHREGSHRAVVLVSDGEDLSGGALDMARRAAEAGVTIFTVGIGSRDGGRIPDAARPGAHVRHDGGEVTTRLDHKTLYEIARITGGAYVPVETAGMGATTLGSIYRKHLRRVSEREFDEALRTRRIERFQWFLLPGVALALAACALSRGRLRGTRRAASKAGGAEAKPLRDLSPPRLPLRNAAAAAAWFAVLTAASGLAAGQTNAPAAPVAAEVAPAVTGRAQAREAQKLFRQGHYEAAARTYLEAADGAGRSGARDFRYNAAVAAYRGDDFRRAAELLSDLDAVAPRPDPDIAAGLGAALFHQAQAVPTESSTNLQQRADLLKSAAEAFRTAARAGDGDEAAGGNLAVALEALPQAVEEAKIARLVERYAQAPAFQVADDMLRAQRDVNERIAAAATNEIPERIRELERLGARQTETADLWIPLKGKLLEALAQQAGAEGQPDLAELTRAMELTRDSMRTTARVLRDNQPEAADAGKVDEKTVFRFWKGMAPSRPLLGEAIRRQGRALDATGGADDDAARGDAGNELAETLDLTQLFRQRFETEFPPAGDAAGAVTETNATAQAGLSEEDREKIRAMADEAILSQKEAAAELERDAAASRDKQERSRELLSQILQLLPREQQEQQEEQPKDQQNQPEPSDQNEQPKEQQEQEPKDQQNQPEPSDQNEQP